PTGRRRTVPALSRYVRIVARSRQNGHPSSTPSSITSWSSQKSWYSRRDATASAIARQDASAIALLISCTDLVVGGLALWHRRLPAPTAPTGQPCGGASSGAQPRRLRSSGSCTPI